VLQKSAENRKIMIYIISSTLFLYNCQKTETEDFDNCIRNLYDNTMLKSSDTDKKSLEEKVALIDLIGKNHIISRNFIKELKSNGFNENELDVNNICRITCYNSLVTILSASLNGTQDKILAFVYNDKYCLLRVTKCANQFDYKTLDGNQLFNAYLDDHAGYISFYNLFKNNALEGFSDYVQFCEMKAQNLKRAHIVEEDCCRHGSTYMGCVHCTLDFFGIDNWYMQAALFRWATELNVALWASCIGAGPNAWC
jgi:hypothetical protein